MRKDYEKIAQEAVQLMKEDPPAINHKPPEMIISAELVEAMDRTVRSNLPLKDFGENFNVKPYFYILYLQYVLPLLFTDDEIKGYFLAQLTDMHSGSPVFRTLDLRRNFKEIVGIEFRFPSSRTDKDRRFVLSELFDVTYKDLFTAELRYPKAIIQKIEDHFHKNEPMPDAYGLFAQYFFGRKDFSFLQIITDLLYVRYGEDRMREYLETTIKKYIAGYPYYQEGGAYLMDIMYYIFGHHFTQNTFNLYYAEVHGHDLDSPLIHNKKLIVKCCWPYCYKHYVVRRERVYEMMDLTDEEKALYDKEYFGNTLRRIVGARVAVAADPKAYKYAYGSTYEEIRNAVHVYYETVVAPGRTIPSREQTLQEVTSLLPPASAIRKDIRHMIAVPALTAWLISFMEEEENALRNRFIEGNRKEILSEKDVIIIYLYRKGRYISRTIDYSTVSSPDFRREIKIYARSVLTQKITVGNIAKVHCAIRFAVDMRERYRIFRCRDVRTAHIYIWLFRFQQAGQTPGSVNLKMLKVRGLMQAVMADESYALRPPTDPTEGIRFFGVRDHVENRPVIPDDILIYLDDHAGELPDDIRLLYQIMRQTCWRFDDAAGLMVENVYDIDDPEYGGIKVVLDKTKKARRKRGAGDYLEDVIPMDLYNDLTDYIRRTAAIREAYGTSLVFYSLQGGTAHQIRCKLFSDKVNDLLVRGGITSIDETYTSFTSSQTRATGATHLAEAGMQPPTVQRKLGHLNPGTTEQHYAHVRKKKLAMKDKEFFDAKFAHLLGPDSEKRLTEDERRILYEDFVFTQETTPFGRCTNHPCGGRCGRRGTAECAECAKLVTGPKNEEAWTKLMDTAQKRVAEFEAAYQAAGIEKEVYAGYPEYRDEVRKLDAYTAVVKKIREWRDT